MAGPEDHIPSPERSNDQLVAVVHAKLDRLVRRRRIRVGTAATAVLSLVVVLGAVAVAQSRGPSTTVVRTADGHLGSADLSTAPALPSSTPTTPVASSTTTSLAEATPPTSATVAPTTVPAHPRRSMPTTTAWPTSTPPPSSTTTLPELASCAPSDVLVSAATDKSRYAIGEPIVVTTTVKNVSDHDCFPPAGGGAQLQDQAGEKANLPGQGFVLDYFAASRWKPGQSTPHTFTFMGTNCATPCLPPTAGTYRVVVSWDVATPEPQTTVTFQVG